MPAKLVTVFSALLIVASGAAIESPRKPNIVVIVSDDHRFDALGCVQKELGKAANYPFFRTPQLDRLAAGGVRFRNGFVTHSLCSPSRATILSGLRTHAHGITFNEQPFTSTRTWPVLLSENGWHTGYFGKWHMGNQRERPGFQEIATFINQGIYHDCPFVVNGTETPSHGWVDDISTGYAIDFIRRCGDKPFALFLGFKTPHDKRSPAKRHEKTYEDVTLSKPSSWSDVPTWRKENGDAWQKRLPDRLAYFQTLAGADDNVGRLLDVLDECGLTEDTLVFYMGDNGYYLGEHGLGDKRTAYEESIRIPFLVRYPRAFQPSIRDEMVLNLDVAATILDACGIQPTWKMHGESMMPMLTSAPAEVSWRDSFFYENYEDPAYPTVTFDVLAVRTSNHKYVTFPGHPEWAQLFDLTKDPTEVRNLISNPEFAPVLDKMKILLEQHKEAVSYSPPPPGIIKK